MGCESGFRWYAGNGAYQGLLQFASSTFSRGLSSIKSRGVKIKRNRKRTVREARSSHYSDGRVVRKRGRKRAQRVTYVYQGKLPRRPAVTHAWAQLRIGAQAIAAGVLCRRVSGAARPDRGRSAVRPESGTGLHGSRPARDASLCIRPSGAIARRRADDWSRSTQRRTN